MSAHDTVAIRGAVDARVQQIGVHEVLRVGDRVRARTQLTVGQLLTGDGTGGDHAVTSRGRIGLAPPRLIKATRVALAITTTRATKTILRRVASATATTTAGAATAATAATGTPTAAAATATATGSVGFADFFVYALWIHCGQRIKILHYRRNVGRPVVYGREDAGTSLFALGVCLCFDGVDVCGTGGDTHRTNGETAAGIAGRDKNNRVVSHRCRGRIEELIFDRLAF